MHTASESGTAFAGPAGSSMPPLPWMHFLDLQGLYVFWTAGVTTGTWCKLMNITLAVLVCACRGGRDTETHAVACLVRIAPSADFWWGNHFHILVQVAERLSIIIGLSWIVSSYCILQHRHRGCWPFEGSSRPERSKFVLEMPRFTLLSVLEVHTGVYKKCTIFSEKHIRQVEGFVEHSSGRATQEEADKPCLVTRNLLYEVQSTS